MITATGDGLWTAVLLCNYNEYSSIPIVQFVHVKEAYKNVKHVLKYEKLELEVIGKFKNIGVLTGLKSCFRKHHSFLF